jgi:hypothetical protein
MKKNEVDPTTNNTNKIIKLHLYSIGKKDRIGPENTAGKALCKLVIL